MNFKIKIIITLLGIWGATLLASTNEFYLALKSENTEEIKRQIAIFIDKWKQEIKNENNTNDNDVYKYCIDTLNHSNWQTSVNLSQEERKKRTLAAKNTDEINGLFFCVIIVGYLEKNQLSIDFFNDIKKKSTVSHKYREILNIWQEIEENFKKNKSFFLAKKIIKDNNLPQYLVNALEDNYLTDVTSQYVMSIISLNPNLLKDNQNYIKYHDKIINLLELKFILLNRDPVNTRVEAFRNQEYFIEVHKSISTTQRHIEWFNVIKHKLSKRLRSRIENSLQKLNK